MEDKRIEILFSLYFIGRKIKSHYKKQNEDVILDAAILMLLRKEGLTISDIAGKLYSKLSSISEKVQRMEREGFVKRQEALIDKREISVHLTSKGKRKLNIIWDTMKEHCVAFITNINDNEIQTLHSLLQTLVNS